MAEQHSSRLVPRLRIVRGEVILLGPGKADLLDAIGRLGSLREAALEQEMSYMRAWKLVPTMNDGFRTALVLFHRGGPARGGAELTETGRAHCAFIGPWKTKSSPAIIERARSIASDHRLAWRPPARGPIRPVSLSESCYFESGEGCSREGESQAG